MDLRRPLLSEKCANTPPSSLSRSEMATKTVIGFDLYGTLLSTESIAKQLALLYGDETAKELAAQWRRYQLEYTWRANSMGESPRRST